MTEPWMSIVLPTFTQRVGLTRNALLSLARQTYRRFHVLLVDDNSPDDGVHQLAREGWPFEINYSRLEHEGEIDIGRSYRWGCAQVQTEMCVVLQSEIVLLPDTLERALELMLDPAGRLQAVQGLPEYIAEPNWMTPEVLERVTHAELDANTLASIAEHGGLPTINEEGKTWPGDPYPREFRNWIVWTLCRFAGTNSRLSGWSEWKVWQHDNPQRQPLLYEHDLWIMFGCFWMESVLDREQVFRTGPHRGFGHEGFNGWKTDTAVWVLPEPVLHQPHFSEPTWAHVHPVREEIWKRFGPQPPVPRPDNAQSDRWRVDD